MNQLTVTGTQSFMGKDIPVVAGGFGKNQKCISDKTVAEIHGMREPDVRRRITDNIKRFKEGVDYIDLKGVHETHTLRLLQNLGYAKQSITQAEHIYLLSERGYAKLIKIMDTDLAWEIHDKLMDEYFQMKEEKKSTPRQPKIESMSSATTAVKTLTPLLEAAGFSKEIQLLTAKAFYQKAAVELPFEIKTEQPYYDTVHIARELGVFTKSGKPASDAVGNIIKKLQIEESEYIETLESKGNWQGSVRKYAPSVNHKVQGWIEEHDYPADIPYIERSGKEKINHVVYRNLSEE
ncbi:ORF6N domain-containing protein [Blautia schinkii]|nr:ORF6N domain-containing protein [Blautia schinkii]